jgi:proteic killer suppression protein
VIRSFKHAGLEKFYQTGSRAGIQPAHATKLQILLTALNAAKEAESMNLPGWGFHGLSKKGRNDLRGHLECE